VTLALLSVSATAQAAPGMEASVQDEAVISHQAWGDRNLALDLTSQLGMGWVRMNVEIDHPFALDEAVDSVRARGMNVQLTIVGQPNAPDPGTFYGLVRTIAQHYAGRVTRYSIWNEPDCCGWLKANRICMSAKEDTTSESATTTRVRSHQYVRRWKRVRVRSHQYVRRWKNVRRRYRRQHRTRYRWVRKRVGKWVASWAYMRGSSTISASRYRALCGLNAVAGRYRQLYEAGYAALKATDPTLQVLLGELSPNHPRELMNNLLSRGPLKADGLAIHPYQPVTPPELAGPEFEGGIGKLDMYNRFTEDPRLRTPANGRVPLYITEFGYFIHGYPKAPASFVLPPAVRADYLTRAWAVACNTPNVREMNQYQLMDTAGRPVWDTGIVDLATGAPDASYVALKSWIEQNPMCVEGR
jgi:hypothetical protein